MKPDVQSPEQAIDFAEALQQSSRAWTAMFDVNADYWKDYSRASLTALDTLRNLNVEQCRPLLLAALQKLSVPAVQQLLALVVDWSVRWIVVGGGGAGTTERLYAETARDITSGAIIDVAGVATRFNGAIPSDLAFQQAFEVLGVRRGWLARYLLRVLERATTGIAEPELVPNEDVLEVNLEHVLPKSPDDQWLKSFSSEEAAILLYWLGNQCLMPKTANENLGNTAFAVKQADLAGSDFRLTSEIGAEGSWTPETIRARQKRLAALAVGAWKRS
jgi:hypothetical protein